MKDNKKVVFLSIIAILILILSVIGLTYAYFANKVINDANVDIETATTSSTEVVYTTGADLILTNAEPGESAQTEFNIKLTSSDMTNDSITYGIDWIIDSNNFEYDTVNTSDPQLTYSMYYSFDNSTWIDYVIDQDCTIWDGTHTIANNQVLSANASETKIVYWRIAVKYMSYDYNQENNMNKSLTGKINVTGLH